MFDKIERKLFVYNVFFEELKSVDGLRRNRIVFMVKDCLSSIVKIFRKYF